MRNTTRWVTWFGLVIGVGGVSGASGQLQDERIPRPRESVLNERISDRIPDVVAYRLLFRAIASRPGTAAEQQKDLRSHFGDAALDDNELETIRLAAQEFHERLLRGERAATTIERGRRGRELTPEETRGLNELRGEREPLTRQIIGTLHRSLTPGGSRALAKYCREHVKPHIALIPRAALVVTSQD